MFNFFRDFSATSGRHRKAREGIGFAGGFVPVQTVLNSHLRFLLIFLSCMSTIRPASSWTTSAVSGTANLLQIARAATDNIPIAGEITAIAANIASAVQV